MIVELSKRETRLDPSRVDNLLSQPNSANFLASQKNLNPTRSTPITGWLTDSLN